MALVEVKADIPIGSVDAVDEALLEVGWQHWSVLEDAATRRAWIVGIFQAESEARESWPAMEELLLATGVPAGIVPAIRTLGDADWRDSYKTHFKAWTFGRLNWVPVWERDTFKVPEGEAVLWLDPGLAFGTGNHETTRLCVERLVTAAEDFGVRGPGVGASESSGRLRVVDAGCGSGILALSAVVLGFHDVKGFDNDPEALRVSEENAALNGLAGRVDFHVADLETGLSDESANIVLANIQADVLMRNARALVEAVAPGGILVLSGILASENSEVRTHFEELARGWIINARVMADWSDIVLTRPR